MWMVLWCTWISQSLWFFYLLSASVFQKYSLVTLFLHLKYSSVSASAAMSTLFSFYEDAIHPSSPGGLVGCFCSHCAVILHVFSKSPSAETSVPW